MRPHRQCSDLLFRWYKVRFLVGCCTLICYEAITKGLRCSESTALLIIGPLDDQFSMPLSTTNLSVPIDEGYLSRPPEQILSAVSNNDKNNFFHRGDGTDAWRQCAWDCGAVLMYVLPAVPRCSTHTRALVTSGPKV